METSSAPPTTVDGDHVDQLVAQWARERPELDTSVLRLGARLVRLSRYLDRTVSELLAPFGLHEGELNVLAALRRAGPPYVLTPTELYRSLLVSSGAMTNRLDRLESAGLLVRTPDPRDRRRVRVGLTDQGRDVIDRTMDVHTEGLTKLFSSLSDDDAAALERLLRSLLLDLEARDPEA
jgi:DNA-binding MarR family transcriptional regulator